MNLMQCFCVGAVARRQEVIFIVKRRSNTGCHGDFMPYFHIAVIVVMESDVDRQLFDNRS